MTLALPFSKGPVFPVGSRWRHPGMDPVVDQWADVTITKYDGTGFYCLSPTVAVLTKRPDEAIPERWVAVLALRAYNRIGDTTL